MRVLVTSFLSLFCLLLSFSFLRLWSIIAGFMVLLCSCISELLGVGLSVFPLIFIASVLVFFLCFPASGLVYFFPGHVIRLEVLLQTPLLTWSFLRGAAVVRCLLRMFEPH